MRTGWRTNGGRSCLNCGKSLTEHWDQRVCPPKAEREELAKKLAWLADNGAGAYRDDLLRAAELLHSPTTQLQVKEYMGTHGVTYRNVEKIEYEDDGSITVVIKTT